MIKSMTGYGKAESVLPGGKMTVEIKSVNHRYGEISVKLPRHLMSYEVDVRKLVSGTLKRGKIDLFIQQEGVAGKDSLPSPNLALARAYHDAMARIGEELGLAGEVSLESVLAQKDVITTGAAEEADDIIREALFSAVSAAVSSIEGMRSREGAALQEDLKMRRGLIESIMSQVSRRAPAVVTEASVRLKERISQLCGDVVPDEARLAQEIALLADRGDITEELVRFESHLRQFDETLQLSEPVGRKLDFLLQELGREVNTIGSKANDAEIAGHVVQLKAELEKVREQVQNIE